MAMSPKPVPPVVTVLESYPGSSGWYLSRAQPELVSAKSQKYLKVSLWIISINSPSEIISTSGGSSWGGSGSSETPIGPVASSPEQEINKAMVKNKNIFFIIISFKQ